MRKRCIQLPILKPLIHKNAFEKQAPAEKAVENFEKTTSQKSVEQARSLDHTLLKGKSLLPTGETVFNELTQKCRQKLSAYLGEKDELIAHMMAERKALIEGRMYF